MQQEKHAHLGERTQIPLVELEQLDEAAFWLLAQQVAAQYHLDPDQAGKEYLIILAHRHRYLLPLADLLDTIPAPAQVTILPCMPDWVSGLTSWRDKLVLVVDLIAYLLPNNHESVEKTLLIVQKEGNFFGLLVPTVEATLCLSPTFSANVRPVQSEEYPESIQGVFQDASQIYLLLNLAWILQQMIGQLQNFRYD